MSDNSQKTPLARSLNRFAEQKVADALQVIGKALPCHVVKVSGSIVTVKFDVNSNFTLPDVTCPMFGPEYIRYPTQVGDLGVVFPADAYLGGVSGLGGGVADLALRANLSALVFFPIANKNWVATDDPDALVLYGVDRATSLELHESGAITGHGEQSLDGSLSTSGNLSSDSAATGTFQSSDGQTIVVVNGIVINIS